MLFFKEFIKEKLGMELFFKMSIVLSLKNKYFIVKIIWMFIKRIEFWVFFLKILITFGRSKGI